MSVRVVIVVPNNGQGLREDGDSGRGRNTVVVVEQDEVLVEMVVLMFLRRSNIAVK